MSTTRGLASGRLPIVTVNTPSLKEAETRSASAFEGSVNERLKVP